jgi:TPR repeat protein
MYAKGRGVPKNIETAVSWYKKAAAQGHQRAKDLLKKLGR